MIIREPGIQTPSFLQAVTPIPVQAAVKTIKQDVKDLALKSNAVDMALGVLIGAAVTPLATSLVKDVIVPPIALLFGGKELDNMHWVLKDGPTPGSYQTIDEAKKDGAVIVRYGSFAQRTINCAVILAITYSLIRLMQTVRKEGGIKKFVRRKRSSASSAVEKLVSGAVRSTISKPTVTK